ncbi:hypothetical protein ABVT39_005054 [Epinephelus coioides]
MAQKGVELDRETFSCSICLDLLKDPVALPCGHSYCINCIQSFWDGEDEKRIYSCPQCHDTVSAAAERTERQRELEGSRQNIQQRIQDTEKDVKLLQQEVEAISRSADKAVEHSEKIFTELIRLMEKRRSDVKQQLRWQQETEFLHNYPSLSALSEATHSSSINIRPRRYFEDVTAAVSGVRDKLQDALRDTWTNASLTGTEIYSV